MADLAKVIKHDQTFQLDVTYPGSDKLTGLTIMVRSAGSDEAKAVLRKQTDQLLDIQQKRKKIRQPQVEKNELEKAASYIASWTWGKDEDGDQANFNGEQPDLNLKNAIKVLDGVDFVFDQVVEAANNIENFSGSSAKR